MKTVRLACTHRDSTEQVHRVRVQDSSSPSVGLSVKVPRHQEAIGPWHTTRSWSGVTRTTGARTGSYRPAKRQRPQAKASKASATASQPHRKALFLRLHTSAGPIQVRRRSTFSLPPCTPRSHRRAPPARPNPSFNADPLRQATLPAQRLCAIMRRAGKASCLRRPR